MKVNLKQVLTACVESKNGGAQHRIMVIRQKGGAFVAEVEEFVEGYHGNWEASGFESYSMGDTPEQAIENAYKAAGSRHREIQFDELEF